MWHGSIPRDSHPAEFPCPTPQSSADAGNRQTSCKVWLTSAERRWCSNETKTRNPLKFAGVPHTRQPISAVSHCKSPYCERPCGGDIAVVMSCMRVCRKQALSRVKYYYYVINSQIQQQQ